MSVFNSAVVTSIDAITVVLIDVDQIVYVFSSAVEAITGAVCAVVAEVGGVVFFQQYCCSLDL